MLFEASKTDGEIEGKEPWGEPTTLVGVFGNEVKLLEPATGIRSFGISLLLHNKPSR